MGCGKTTVGKLLAEELGYSFIDLDKYIEKKVGDSIPNIFQHKGEKSFRKLELKYLKELKTLNKTVVALGGGTPCDPMNWKYIDFDRSIYLMVSISQLTSRLSQDPSKRPLLKGLQTKAALNDYIRTKLRTRRAAYSKASIRLRNNKNPSTIVERIINVF